MKTINHQEDKIAWTLILKEIQHQEELCHKLMVVLEDQHLSVRPLRRLLIHFQETHSSFEYNLKL